MQGPDSLDRIRNVENFQFKNLTLSRSQLESAAANGGSLAQYNIAPNANDDSKSFGQDQTVTFNVLANDNDPDGDTLTLVGISQPLHGTVSFTEDGNVTYTPHTGFTGVETLTYTMTDGTSARNAIIHLAISNLAPVTGIDNATTLMSQAVTINPLVNDSDPENGTLTLVSVSTPSNGTLVQNPDGTVTYTPNAGYAGIETITYVVADPQGNTSNGTMKFTVTNQLPTPIVDVDASADKIDTEANAGDAVGIKAFATDPDGTGITYKLTNTAGGRTPLLALLW